MHSLDERMLTDEKNFAGFPKKEACLKNLVNVTYFQTIYVAASSLNVKRLFDSELKKSNNWKTAVIHAVWNKPATSCLI